MSKEPHEWSEKMQPKARAIHKYFNYKNEIRYLSGILNLTEIPSSIDSIQFIVPMPKSWSNRKRELMDGSLHKQRPDLDNFLKALFDAVHTEDSHIAQIRNGLEKLWGTSGQIIIRL